MMGNLMEAVLAIMGLVSGFYALALMLGHPGPTPSGRETVLPERSHAIHPHDEKLAA